MQTVECCLLAVAAATALVMPASAHSSERRATLTGDGGRSSPKCTVEVYVDGTADVEIRGDRGFLRTLSGQPARWRRFECSEPMSPNPGDVRFSGVEGRGRQELVQNPKGGPGVAVVRIQDPDGGAEAYKFDLVWREAGHTGKDAASACRRAAELQIHRDGYRHVKFGLLDVGNSGNGKLAGTAVAHRGDAGRPYDFNIRCTVDLTSGNIRRVQTVRR